MEDYYQCDESLLKSDTPGEPCGICGEQVKRKVMEEYQEILENWVNGNQLDVFKAYQKMLDSEKEMFVMKSREYGEDFVDILSYLLIKLI